MKNLVFTVFFVVVVLVTSCGVGDIVEPTDPTIQASEDSTTIVNYIADLGFSDIDSVLTSGVHYVILDSGDAETIDESDIVSFNFIGKLLNDTIFDTSIQEVSDSIRLAVEANITEGDTLDVELVLLTSFDEDRVFEPFEIAYSASGWTVDGRFIDGFSQGIAATFRQLKVGGSALIVIPSAEAYGASGRGFLIGPNEVLAFELFPVEVRKQ